MPNNASDHYYFLILGASEWHLMCPGKALSGRQHQSGKLGSAIAELASTTGQ